jgi:hypothetical protein
MGNTQLNPPVGVAGYRMFIEQNYGTCGPSTDVLPIKNEFCFVFHRYPRLLEGNQYKFGVLNQKPSVYGLSVLGHEKPLGNSTKCFNMVQT